MCLTVLMAASAVVMGWINPSVAIWSAPDLPIPNVTQEALCVLAYSAPSAHAVVVNSLTSVSFNNRYTDAVAGVWPTTGRMMWGPLAFDGFRYPPRRWATVLYHEALHVQGADELQALVGALRLARALGVSEQHRLDRGPSIAKAIWEHLDAGPR